MGVEDRTPLDQLVELLVYAPLGLALTAHESVPELAAKGRERLSSQVALARFVGQYVVTKTEKHAKVRLEEASRILATLWPAEAPEPAPTTSGQAPSRPPAPAAARVPSPSATGPARVNGRRAAGSGSRGATAAALAIPGYDTLSASQVVPRLAGLASDELEAVREYEARTRGRRTILSKIAQLQTPPG